MQAGRKKKIKRITRGKETVVKSGGKMKKNMSVAKSRTQTKGSGGERGKPTSQKPKRHRAKEMQKKKGVTKLLRRGGGLEHICQKRVKRAVAGRGQ